MSVLVVIDQFARHPEHPMMRSVRDMLPRSIEVPTHYLEPVAWRGVLACAEQLPLSRRACEGHSLQWSRTGTQRSSVAASPALYSWLGWSTTHDGVGKGSVGHSDGHSATRYAG
jgi:hypothetical protein